MARSAIPGCILATIDPAKLVMVRTVPMRMKRRGCEMRLVIDGAPSAKADPVLAKAIARARAWFGQLSSGAVPLAEQEGLAVRSIPRSCRWPSSPMISSPRSLPAPSRPGLTAEALIKRTDLPADWAEQRQALGFV